MRRGCVRSSTSDSASSTIVSVSGRGTSTAGVTASGRPQNSRRADDARDRLSGEPARFEGRDLRGLDLDQRARRRRHQGGVIEAERVTDQHTRVEIGRIEPGGAEGSGERRVAPVRRSFPA